MKVKLITKEENYTILKLMLEKGGFEVSDDANLVLKDNIEEAFFYGDQDHEIIPIPFRDVLYIESYGRDVYINTINNFIRLKNRLYEVEESLEGKDFVRISKSVIVSKTGIQRIKPIINGRFDLIMKNNETVTVTKSYRNSFRSFIGF
ncbi:MAG: LytTR family transcriptional regulator [Bacillus subtilis]|nr:LytTR family transcriptional regulator [Bacillus subtilis]